MYLPPVESFIDLVAPLSTSDIGESRSARAIMPIGSMPESAGRQAGRVSQRGFWRICVCGLPPIRGRNFSHVGDRFSEPVATRAGAGLLLRGDPGIGADGHS